MAVSTSTLLTIAHAGIPQEEKSVKPGTTTGFFESIKLSSNKICIALDGARFLNTYRIRVPADAYKLTSNIYEPLKILAALHWRGGSSSRPNHSEFWSRSSTVVKVLNQNIRDDGSHQKKVHSNHDSARWIPIKKCWWFWPVRSVGCFIRITSTRPLDKRSSKTGTDARLANEFLSDS